MKIAILRALQLGDLLCAVPAFRALRGAFPDAEISLIGLPWSKAFVARFHRYLDRHIEFPGFPGMPERACGAAQVGAFLERMRAERFDLALQLHGDGSHVNDIVARMGARRIAGFHLPGEAPPDPASFIEWRPREHEVLRFLRLLERMGIRSRGEHLEFPLFAADYAEAAPLGRAPYAVVHPGSQLPSRRWPAERFAQVADALVAQGLRIVLTGSPSEQALTNNVRSAMSQPATDLSGRTSLGGLAAVIAGARLLVSNDTSVSHIAAAVRTRSVVVACGSDPRRWAPLERDLHRVLHHEVACRPCAYRECPVGHPCALGVSTLHVVNEVRELFRCAA